MNSHLEMPFSTDHMQSLKKVAKNRHITFNWLNKGEIALPLFAWISAVISVCVFGHVFSEEKATLNRLFLEHFSIGLISQYAPESNLYFP